MTTTTQPLFVQKEHILDLYYWVDTEIPRRMIDRGRPPALHPSETLAIVGGIGYWGMSSVFNVPSSEQSTTVRSIGHTQTTPSQKPVHNSTMPSRLTANFEGHIEIPTNQDVSILIFYGDGGVEVLSLAKLHVFDQKWSHVYLAPGEYDATLVITDRTNIGSDLKVISDPAYQKNTIVNKTHITVNPPKPPSL